MTQEEKELLIKDICARLPYGVIMTNIKLPETNYPLTCEDLHDAMFDDDWDDVPYLRPMSSMTEDEKKEFNQFGCGVLECSPQFEIEEFYKVIDWLNTHHFDYRNLIGKELALKAPDGMYKTE